MAENMATPRINANYLESFTNQTVRIVGKVIQLRGDEATIDSQGSVIARLNRDCHLSVGSAIEIIGKVNQDFSVKVLQATDLGTSFDYAANLALVEVTHLHPQIFYTK